MKTLNQYIKESILDDEEDIISSAPEVLIRDFISNNYKITGKLDIKKSNNKYIVDCDYNVEVKNRKITQLTIGIFEWGVVEGSFYCSDCKSLKSLKGAPEKVEGSFYCYNCASLKDLTGAPEKIGGWFNCSNCNSLTSLEGAPKEVGKDFDCYGCKSLTTLKGAPKKVGWNFNCGDCGTQFTKEDVEKESKVKGGIYV